MRNLLISAAFAAAASFATPANALTLPDGGGLNGVVEDVGHVDNAQVFVYLGRPYCFYLNGWHGPGWYRCGFAWRSGYGWGGFYGWNNWYHPRYHARFHRRHLRHDRRDVRRDFRQERRQDRRDVRREFRDDRRRDVRREFRQDGQGARIERQGRQERQLNRMGGEPRGTVGAGPRGGDFRGGGEIRGGGGNPGAAGGGGRGGGGGQGGGGRGGGGGDGGGRGGNR